MNTLNSTLYLHLLEPWAQAASEHFYVPAGQDEIICYGDGGSENWPIQTNMKAFAAFAVLASDPEMNQNRSGMSRDELLATALRLLRYSLKTHKTGTAVCGDGKQWGCTWISVLGIERMMHGVDAIEAHLNEEDKMNLRRVLESESDFLLNEHDVVADLIMDNNVPESNIWNGCVLLRTALYYPDTKHREAYLEKATAFLLNGISIPDDADSADIFYGKTLQEWHVGPNFGNNYSLGHHGYMNVGYMVICLSNIAMLHFSLKKRGIDAPAELYHHAYDLWKVIKQFTFPDGRLLRIGGDTRARYCYCQDYAIPMWLFVLDKYGDMDTLNFEQGWIAQVAKEVAFNEDGSFLGKRLESMSKDSLFYYTRLESDRSVTLSQGNYWRRIFPELALAFPLSRDCGAACPTEMPCPDVQWDDAYHGATFVRGKSRIASLVWVAAQGPTGMCIPPACSNMGEWQCNLVGEPVTPSQVWPEIVSHDHEMFKGGFVNYGIMEWREQNPLGESASEKIFARHYIAYAALPDGQTTVCLQYAVCLQRLQLKVYKGINLKMPNDLFNDMTRRYASETGMIELHGLPGQAETIAVDSNWLNIDNTLSIINISHGGGFTIIRPAERQIIIRKHIPPFIPSLYADEILTGLKTINGYINPGDSLMDTGAVLIAGIGAEETREFQAGDPIEYTESENDRIRVITVRALDGRKYTLAANFTDSEQSVKLGDAPIILNPGEAKLCHHSPRFGVIP